MASIFFPLLSWGIPTALHCAAETRIQTDTLSLPHAHTQTYKCPPPQFLHAFANTLATPRTTVTHHHHACLAWVPLHRRRGGNTTGRFRLKKVGGGTLTVVEKWDEASVGRKSVKTACRILGSNVHRCLSLPWVFVCVLCGLSHRCMPRVVGDV